MTRTLFLDPGNARDRMKAAWLIACELLQFGKSVRVRLDEKQPTRSIEQNDKLHAVCHDISKQRQ
jgi:hypothetical protein